jgi:hypothetical protein
MASKPHAPAALAPPASAYRRRARAACVRPTSHRTVTHDPARTPHVRLRRKSEDGALYGRVDSDVAAALAERHLRAARLLLVHYVDGALAPSSF